MISVIESQPAGSDVDLVAQVDHIFSRDRLFSRASNFEYRPQQQQMAVASQGVAKRAERLLFCSRERSDLRAESV